MPSITTRIRHYHGIETRIYEYKYYNSDEKRKTFGASENQYGKYARKIVELSVKEMKPVRTYIIEKKHYAIMKLYSKVYGYVDVKIDKDDIDKVKYYNWTITSSNKGKLLYIRHNKLGRLHRYLMNVTDPELEVDHKNRNTLDCRKRNLRPCTKSDNCKNRRISEHNRSGIIGVRYDSKNDYWWAQIQINGKQYSKSWSCTKYGYNLARKNAINWRKEKEKENNYLVE